MQEKYLQDLLFINAHTPCCDNEDSRQKEIDNFMSFIREAKESGGVLTLEHGTPIVIVGDMNLVGYKQQQTTLVTGDIVNTNIYGDVFLPDWDDSFFKDLTPITTNMPSTFTWYDEGSSFSPGRLDYVVYSDSQLDSVNSFALFTPALPDDTLSVYNLQSNDVTSVADHIPVVVDFKILNEVAVNENAKENYKFELIQNYPNPFNPSTTISYTIPQMKSQFDTTTKLTIYNALGSLITTLVDIEQSPGSYSIKFDGSKLTSGIYYYKISSGQFTTTKKMILLK
jgi:hypothetical protein